MDRETWLKERRTGIGSSDAAAICNLSPWSTPDGVYLDKTGQLPPQPPSTAMSLGLRLEPVIADLYSEATGTRLTIPDPAIWRHTDRPWMLASLDRIALDRRVVELKTASAYQADDWGEAGTDEIPIPYIIQVQHQLAVSGWEQADVAVLIGGQDFRIYTVERNNRLIGRLLAIEQAFWDMVRSRTRPEPTWGHPATLSILDAIYDADPTLSVPLPASVLESVDLFEAARGKMKEAAEAKEVAKARILYELGAAGSGILPDGRTVQRRKVNRAGYTVPPCTYHSFRITHAKGDS